MTERTLEIDGDTVRIASWASDAGSGWDVYGPNGAHVGTIYSDGFGRPGRGRVQLGRKQIRGTIDDLAATVYRANSPREACAPKPGSVAALASGCTCPRLANRMGAGNDGRYFIAPDCGIHGKALACTA